MSLAAALAAIVADLEAAGLAGVVDDPRDLQAPGVLVGMPDDLTPAPCGMSGTVSVWVVAAPPGNAEARDDLLERLEVAAKALDWTRAAAGSFFPESGGPGLPGYRLTVPVY